VLYTTRPPYKELQVPFASQAQARFMHAAAKDKKMAKKMGVPQSVAKKFVKDSQSSLAKLPTKVKKK
jgi:hypothetical protein